MWVVVHFGIAYGPFGGRQKAIDWVAGSSIANDSYSIHPLMAHTVLNALPLVNVPQGPTADCRGTTAVQS